MTDQKGSFIIRVYGLLLDSQHRVLVTDEFQLNQRMTKFPGGGLEYGEGPEECLIREIREECNGQELYDIAHFYTTGYFQPALFYPNHQLISIYYTARLLSPLKFATSNNPFDFTENKNGNQSFRWVNIHALEEVSFTFPIDRFVVNLLKKSNFSAP